MSAKTKMYVQWTVIALVLYFVLRSPLQAAGLVHSGVHLLHLAANNGITFVRASTS
ncbi:MAG TPA: hypothetical protein VGJ13_10560 [Pseudonocardiaceae bacterium]|jgi:hypothetical protein